MIAAFVPARGGSVRVPRKNLALVGDRTLLQRAIDSAGPCDRVVVSTDDDEIADAARAAGAEVHVDPEHLRGGQGYQLEALMLAWLHRLPAAELVATEAMVLLQPTSPFRTAATVARALDLYRSAELDSVVGAHVDVRRATFAGRFGSHGVTWDRPLDWRPRTQDAPKVPVENGSLYVVRADWLKAMRCRMGGRSRVCVVDALEGFDVDTPEELEIARAIAQVNGR